MRVWLPLVTFVMGQLFAIGLAYASNRWQHSREKEARAEQRGDEQRLFQRDTLLELQESLLELQRAVFQASVERFRSSREPGGWEKAKPTPDTRAWRERVQDRTEMLVQRVTDDELRESWGTAKLAAEFALIIESDEDDSEAFSRWHQSSRDLSQRVGEVLRQRL